MKPKQWLAGSLFFFCLSQSLAQITHQRVFDTVPYIMHHHQNRLKQFEKDPMSTGQIIFLGNSITEGGQWQAYFPDSKVLNRGIGGDISFGIINRLSEITERKPNKLFLLIGINDIGMDIPEAVIANNIAKIIQRIQSESPRTRIIVQSILPVNPEFDGFPQHYDKQYRVLMTNQLLFKVCAEHEVEFLNLFPFFLDNRQRLKSELTYDGLHLNEAGYALWVKILKSEGLME